MNIEYQYEYQYEYEYIYFIINNIYIHIAINSNRYRENIESCLTKIFAIFAIFGCKLPLFVI